MLEILAKN